MPCIKCVTFELLLKNSFNAKCWQMTAHFKAD